MTGVRKQPAITPEMVKERTHLILSALSKNNEFEFNLMMQQLSNWTVAKRRQVFRSILKTLLNSTATFEHKYLRPNIAQYGTPIYYSIHINTIRSNALDMFVDKIKSMDANERFSPEKVFTLKKLSSKLMNSTPATLEYLFENNIVILSPTFEYGSPNMTEIDSSIRMYYYMSMRLDIVSKVYTDLGLYMDVMLCPMKFQLVQIANISKNITSLGKRLIKDEANITLDEKSTLRVIIQNMDLILRDIKGGIKPKSHVPQNRWDETMVKLKALPAHNSMPVEEYLNTKEYIANKIFQQRMLFSNMIAGDIAPEEVHEIIGFNPFSVRI